MVRIEPSVGYGYVVPVVVDTSMTHNQRANTDVERLMLRGVFRGQRIEHELVVGRRERIFLIEMPLQSEQLRR